MYNNIKVTRISHSAFNECGNSENGITTKITIPKQIKSIGVYGIGNSYKFTEVIIEPGSQLEEIEAQAFECLGWTGNGQKKIPKFIFPPSIKIIHENAFKNAIGVEKYYYCGLTQISNNTFLDSDNVKIFVSQEYKNKYGSKFGSKTAYVWEDESCFNIDSGNEIYKYLLNWQGSGFTVGDNKTRGGLKNDKSCPDHIELESIINNIPVTKIARNAFEGCSSTSVTIPQTITEIHVGAFKSCKSLQTLSFSGSFIGNSAFEGCINLITLNLQHTVSIGNRAFFGDKKIKTVSFLNSVTSIGDSAFEECTGIKTLCFDNEGTIGANAFKGTSNLNLVSISKTLSFDSSSFNNSGIKRLIVNSGASLQIQARAFATCANLNSIELNGVTSIGESAFEGLSFLRTITLGTKVTKIGDRAFKGVGSIVLDIKSNVRSIGTSAFAGCGVTAVTIQKNPKLTIPSSCFESCYSLGKVTILGVKQIGPNAFKKTIVSELQIDEVNTISESAFAECPNLLTVVLPPSVQSLSSLSFANSGIINLTIEESPDFDIPDRAFKSCPMLATLHIKAINKIGKQAFSNLQMLSSVNICSLRSIDEEAFSECSNLKTITLPTNLEQIHPSSFQSCGLENLVIGGFLDFEIPSSCFQSCTNLKNVKLKQMRKIGDSAFKSLQSLSTVVMEDVSIIDARAFQQCTALNEIILPSSITSIHNTSFSKSSLLRLAIKENSNFDIPDGAFSECKSLESVGIESVKSIGVGAFQNLGSLKTVNLGRVLTISARAFNGCTNLKIIAFGEGLKEIGESAFEGVSISSLITPSTLRMINRSAFAKTSIEILNIRSADSIIINYEAFANCSLLTSIKIESISCEFKERVFYDCSELTEVQLCDNVLSIGNESFAYTSSLELFNVSKSTRYIGYLAFSNSGLRKITIADSDIALDIYNESFANCKDLTQIDFGARQIKIYGNAFANCRYIRHLSFSGKKVEFTEDALQNSGITTILASDGDELFYVGNGTFSNNKGIWKFVVGKRPLIICSNGFTNSSIQIVDISKTDINNITERSFDNCKRLKTFKISESVQSIGEEALINCTRLASIKIPAGVIKIGAKAFKGCTGLCEITFSSNTTGLSIGSEAFAEVGTVVQRGLTIIFPDGVENISDSAFSDADISVAIFSEHSPKDIS